MEKEIYTEQIMAGKRTYFMDVKESAKGAKYLVLTESKKLDDDTFERHSIMIFEEDIEKFALAFIKTTYKMK